ncbi:hypothetical protein L484_006445 [Morus notabilis]|uniref:Uncharacterized protein n=1 Tax=Morus notabilis TaxID=981085 RepID=W9S592_9ROSA|nr:hypothetical protein L484_006445 [Morus notabilis]
MANGDFSIPQVTPRHISLTVLSSEYTRFKAREHQLLSMWLNMPRQVWPTQFSVRCWGLI